MGRPIVCVEGIVGSGKTTLCLDLANYLDAQVVLDHTETPALRDVLNRYYVDPEGHALELQLFLLERKTVSVQWALHEARRGVGGQLVLQDRGLAGDYAAAQGRLAMGYMDFTEWRLYSSLYRAAMADSVPPAVLIYLDIDPADALLRVCVPEVGLPELRRQSAAYEETIRAMLDGRHPWSSACVLRVPATTAICGLGLSWYIWSELTARGFDLRPFSGLATSTPESMPPCTSMPLARGRALAG